MYVQEWQIGIAVGLFLILVVALIITSYRLGKRKAARVSIDVFRDCFSSNGPFTPEPRVLSVDSTLKHFIGQIGIKLKVTKHLYRDGKLVYDSEQKSDYRNRPRSKRRYSVVNFLKNI